MRTILTILCLVLLSSCSQESEVVTGPFLIRDGVTFDQNTNTRVTGIIEDYHENGQLSTRSNYTDGERDDLYESYDENGNVITRASRLRALAQ